MKLELEYFYQKDVQSLTFYKLPKVLFSDSRLKPLTNEAKILYTIMLDRVSLSIANGWLDDIGRVFIYYTVKESCDMLNKSDRHLSKILAELDDVKGLGLIERKKQGLGRPDVIYVKNLASLPEEIQEQGSENPEKKTEKKSKKSGDFKAKPPISQEKLSTIPEKSSVENFLDKQSIPLLNGNPCVSRHENYSGQEPNSFPPNNTNITNTEQIKTDIFRPTLPPNPTPTFPQFHDNQEFLETWGEGWREMTADTKSFVISREMEQAYQVGKEELQYLMFNYRTDSDTMSLVLDYLMNMEELDNMNYGNQELSQEQFYFKTTKLYKQALLEMLTEGQHTKTKHGFISYAKVIEKVLAHLQLDKYNFSVKLDNIVECTVLEYMDAAAETNIKHKLNYMKTCIWSTFLTGNIYDEQRYHKFATDLHFGGYERDNYGNQ